jgi:transposase
MMVDLSQGFKDMLALLREARHGIDKVTSGVNLNQKKALYRYLEDGRLRPDNNLAENAIRPLALGRKNWLFAASDRGARATALYLGLIQSCKAFSVNPWEYFNDMLRRIMSHPVNRLRELLPDQWKPLS